MYHSSFRSDGPKRPGGGLVILHPSDASVLLVRDDRHNKWSFPKGRMEAEDYDLLETAVRETREETGFEHNRHYVLKTKMRTCARTQLVLAQALTPDLPLHSCAEHHVAEVAWIPFHDVGSLDANLPLRLWAEKEGWVI
jgi:8-oxo-dGTP pyrophosphatase MutT (NUDIX family)